MSASNTGPSGGSQSRPEASELNADGEAPSYEELGEVQRSNGSELSKDEVFELLRNSRRRTVIRYLRSGDGEASLSELAEHTAALENDIEVAELSSDQRKRVYIGLYQCHLPKMDSLGVVEYDKNRGTVELQESVSQLEPYMGSMDDDDGRARLGVAVAGAVLVAVFVGLLGPGPLAAVPAVAWAGLSLAGAATLGLLQVA